MPGFYYSLECNESIPVGKRDPSLIYETNMKFDTAFPTAQEAFR